MSLNYLKQKQNLIHSYLLNKNTNQVFLENKKEGVKILFIPKSRKCMDLNLIGMMFIWIQ